MATFTLKNKDHTYWPTLACFHPHIIVFVPCNFHWFMCWLHYFVQMFCVIFNLKLHEGLMQVKDWPLLLH